MTLFGLAELEAATSVVRTLMAPTPAYAWPLLGQRLGVHVVVKHENHTPIGAFKARGSIVYLDELRRMGQQPAGFVSATRGNHGQALALAAQRHNKPVVIVVPEHNSAEKNAAMRALGAELVVFGNDFDESRVHAAAIERERGFHFVPAFHRDIVRGVATYAHELLAGAAEYDVVYVPIGMGSGICGLITVRDLLGLKTDIVGVVAASAPAYARSFDAGRPVATPTAHTFADGMACREPHPDAVAIINAGAARVVAVTEDEIAAAIRLTYAATHNVAEGAGAAALAALMRERQEGKLLSGGRAGVVLSGGNIDLGVLRQVLNGETPQVPGPPSTPA